MLNRYMLALVAPLIGFGCAPAGSEATTTQAVAETAQPADQPEPEPAPDPRLFRDCADCPQMVRIPAGSFTMGSPADEPERQADEGPQRKVTIGKPFAISAYEISTGEYRRFIESTGRSEVEWKMTWTWETVGAGKAPVEPDLFPARAVSWRDAQDYAAWLSKLTGQRYRLPTEAEWEYVARAGDPGARYEPDVLRRPLPNWETDQVGYSYPVLAFAANAFGVHGLTANGSEWVADCYRDGYAQAPADGGAVEGECKQRALRGGYNVNFPAAFERIANRSWGYDTMRGNDGIRLVRELP